MNFQSIGSLFVSLSLLVMACSSSKPATDTLSLTETRWVLVDVQGQPVKSSGTDRDASIQFTDADHKVTGSTGCNRMFGTYELPDAGKIKFVGIGSTKMACPDMSTESAFVKALEQTNAYSISGNELQLKNDQTLVARLQAQASN
ncbi:META domain-containing protein [Spirosoma endophyticum]|uniref:Heat shock protein HslJ n=1 Tax=Spirosoma endophyticum TaxID=662367 RepID=A0A1I1YY45_9BACT|nr:META domain-containing protein [Spirosoma endophyticum]SFE23083.1 Heat shock protein HslJ [Spirosoma endophyticum]